MALNPTTTHVGMMPERPLQLDVEAHTPEISFLSDRHVRFFVTEEFTKPIGEMHLSTINRGYLFSNESHFDRFFEEIPETGGTVIGVAGLQNLELAAAAQAGALIIVDISPLQIPFLLSALEMVARYDQSEFIAALQPLRKRRDVEAVLPTEIGERYRIAPALIKLLQKQSPFSIGASGFFDKILPNREGPFWKDPATYASVQAMVQRGDVSVILGDFFGEETQRLIAQEITRYNNPVSSLYLSNAPEWVKVDFGGRKAIRTSSLLAHPLINPQGQLLMTTERTDCRNVNATRRQHNDVFTYHALPLSDVRQDLRQKKTIPAWTRGIQQRAGLKLNQRSYLPSHP